MNTLCEREAAPLQIAAIRDLPMLPAAVLELVEMLGRDDIDMVALAAKMSFDPGLATKMMRLANSSFYGVPRHVTSVSAATAVLGLRTVRTVVFAAAFTRSFEPPACRGFDFAAFWRHAIGSAVAAKLVAAAIGAEPEPAFTAGLMHDIGQLVLATCLPERYAEVLEQHQRSGCEIEAAEQQGLATDHAAVGAMAAERWRFPAEIAAAIGAHHDAPAHAAADSLACIVRVSGQLVEALDQDACGAMPAACDRAWTGIGLAPEAWARIGAQVTLETQAICATLID